MDALQQHILSLSSHFNDRLWQNVLPYSNSRRVCTKTWCVVNQRFGTPQSAGWRRRGDEESISSTGGLAGTFPKEELLIVLSLDKYSYSKWKLLFGGSDLREGEEPAYLPAPAAVLRGTADTHPEPPDRSVRFPPEMENATPACSQISTTNVSDRQASHILELRLLSSVMSPNYSSTGFCCVIRSSESYIVARNDMLLSMLTYFLEVEKLVFKHATGKLLSKENFRFKMLFSLP